ncbi:MAG: succinyl-diaminopimelate desuccinylase [Rickettsiaceae bacterium]
MKYIEYLQKLISFSSITPDSSGSIEYVNSLLIEMGFQTKVKIFGKRDYSVMNLYASYGEGSPNICFAGHLDVVPPGELKLWNSNPFQARLDDDKIYGRGAVDMKGAIACMLAAAFDFIDNIGNSNSRDQNFGSISFLFTTDEEGDAHYGIKEMMPYLNEQGVKIDFCILGEPTSSKFVGDQVKIGRRGSANFTLTIYGKQGHVAYPELANNPITDAINILSDIGQYEFDQGNEIFAQTNLEITSIDVGNKVNNIIPDKIVIKFNIRFNNIQSLQTLEDSLKSLIKQHNVRYDLVNLSCSNGFYQNIDDEIKNFAKIVESVTNNKTVLSTSGGISDARFIKDYTKVVELGLLNGTAHKINEFVGIKDLQILYELYRKILYNMLYK